MKMAASARSQGRKGWNLRLPRGRTLFSLHLGKSVRVAGEEGNAGGERREAEVASIFWVHKGKLGHCPRRPGMREKQLRHRRMEKVGKAATGKAKWT